MDLRKLISIVLKIIFAILLLVILVFNIVIDVNRSKLIHTTTTNENVKELVPPAFSLCSNNNFKFDCNVYGETLANCANLVRIANVSNDETYNSWFTSCNVFQTTQPMLFSTPKRQPKDWAPNNSPLFVKYSLQNVSTANSLKVAFMLWNSYDLPSSAGLDTELSTKATPQILNPYRLVQMDAMRERVFSFYWRKHIFLNNTEKFYLDYKLELDESTSTTASGFVHFKPASFNMEVTREHRCFPAFSVFIMFIVLSAVLYTTYWGLFSGKGKYKTWGLAHIITGYYPQQHILPMENTQSLKPTADDVLRVYLDGLDRAEFKKK